MQQRPAETAIAIQQQMRRPQRRVSGFFTSRLPALLASLICLFTVAILLPGTAQARYAAVVMDSRTGEILYSRNPDEQLYPASLTKIMTLYLTFEALQRGQLRLDQRLPVSARAAGQPPTKLDLKKGETITVRDAMFGLITKSANDAATVLAEAMAPSEEDFARRMTEKARALGMTRTTFRNASGLPNQYQKSTARDMAILGAALIHHFPQYYQFMSLQEFNYKGRRHKNHNNLLGNYQGADGIKTGYIRASGYNLVASVKRGNDRLIGVIFGGQSAKSRDAQMVSLLDRGFEKIEAIYRGTVPTPFDKPLRIALGQPHDSIGEVTFAAHRDETVVPVPTPATATPARVYKVGDVNDTGVSVTRGTTATATNAGIEADQAANAKWAIQIGAFSQKATAEDQVNKAAEQSAHILQGRRVNIERALSDGKPFYRAQFVGFEEEEARQACSTLAQRRVSCFVVSPDVKLPNYIAQKSNS